MGIITLVTTIATDSRLSKSVMRSAGAVETQSHSSREDVKQAHGQAGGVNVFF